MLMDTEIFTEPSYNATASKILETAMQLFMQRGYRAVSINDIVKAADVTKPTLYYYFPDKEALFAQMGLQLLAQMHAALQAALEREMDFTARLTAMAAVLMNDRDEDMRMMRHEMQEHLSAVHQQRLGQAFRAYIFEPLRREMQAGLDAGFLVGTSAFELALLFLGLMEAFHPQPGNMRVSSLSEQPDEALSPAVFTPETVIALFLYGVTAKTRSPGMGCAQ